MKAIILAGGFGTRLRNVTGDLIPKPMVDIYGKPFLEHQIRFLKKQDIEDIVIAVHHRADEIKSHFRNGGNFGIKITYSDEDKPLGTGGAIKNAEKYIDNTFLVLNGDSYSKINLEEFIDFHKRKRGIGSVALKEIENISDFGTVKLEGERIVSYNEKSETGKGIINCGLYVLEPQIFDYIDNESHVSLEKIVFPRLAKEKKLFGYMYDGYFMDIGKPETYKQFKNDFLENIAMFSDSGIREAMHKMKDNGTDLIIVTDRNKKLLGVLNNRILTNYFMEKHGNLDDQIKNASQFPEIVASEDDSEERINEIFKGDTNRLPILDKSGRVTDVKFRSNLVTVKMPSVSGKVPLRISFAGGGTDLPEFFEKYGGVVISSTIDKYCHATINKRADYKIILNSDLENEVVLDHNNLQYDGGKYDVVKAVTNLIKPDFGFELYLHNDIPPGRGLGSSASLAVLMTKLLGELKGGYNDEEVAEIAYRAETKELNIKGGKQDQYAAVYGGFNWMEFSNGDKKIIHPLRIDEEVKNELNCRLILSYTGDHSSLTQQANLGKSISENEIVDKLNNLKDIAGKIKDCLLSSTPSLEKIGGLLDESWAIKRSISGISNSYIDNLYNVALKNGSYGGKLLGSGGGGYLLLAYSPKKRNQMINSLEKEGGEVMNFNFVSEGVKTWKSN